MKNKKIITALLCTALTFTLSSCHTYYKTVEENRNNPNRTKYYNSKIANKTTEAAEQITESQTIPETSAPKPENPILSLNGVIKGNDYVIACSRKDLDGITAEQLREFSDKYYVGYKKVFYFGDNKGLVIQDGLFLAEYGDYHISGGFLWDTFTIVDFNSDFIIRNPVTLEDQNIGQEFDSTYILQTEKKK